MAVPGVMCAFAKRLRLSEHPLKAVWPRPCLQRHHASTQVKAPAQELQDLEESSFGANDRSHDEAIAAFDPVANAIKRNHNLPPSRYSYRAPLYDRGPLHPHQSPRDADPVSRRFLPGPFSLPRLEQTYESTIAPDLLTLAYVHYPPGFEPHQKGPRLREWVGDSPYFKNRPLRGPRGYSALPLLRRRMTPHNIPKLKRVTVHTFVKGAKDSSAYLHVAGMILQAITNVRATPHKTKKANANFAIQANKAMSLTCDLYGEDMHHFLSKLVDVVLPRVKDWKGVKGSTGDSSGNLAFGLTPEEVALFPEVEINYDSYPPKMVPGLHIMIHTTATQDREARMLLGSIGFPFTGKLID